MQHSHSREGKWTLRQSVNSPPFYKRKGVARLCQLVTESSQKPVPLYLRQILILSFLVCLDI